MLYICDNLRRKVARVILFVESVELNPRGAAYYPDIIRALVERYQFNSFPQKEAEYDEQKGIVLASGKYHDRTIQMVTIYNWGLTLDTTSSTDDSEDLLLDALAWGADKLRLNFHPELIKRKSFASQILFYSDAPLLSLNPILSELGELISKEVSENLRLPYVFQPRGFTLGIDPEQQRIAVAPFAIERREGVAFWEHKYFSSAPVSTTTHLSLLERVERAAGARK